MHVVCRLPLRKTLKLCNTRCYEFCHENFKVEDALSYFVSEIYEFKAVFNFFLKNVKF
jgi:hypothetical protein